MNSEDSRLQKLEAKVEQHSMIVEQHSLIMKGDDTEYPPKPGVMHVLKQISDTISHPESGNVALFHQVKGMKEKDQQRVAFLGGVKFVTVLIWTLGGALVGGLVTLGLKLHF